MDKLQRYKLPGIPDEIMCKSEDVTALEAALSAAREENDTLLKENAGLKGELIVVKAENERLKNKMDEYLDKFNELSLQAVRYRDENERLERCRQITDRSWQELTEENAQLKARVEELEGALKDTVRRASNLSATS